MGDEIKAAAIAEQQSDEHTKGPSSLLLAATMTFLVAVWSANYVVGKVGLRELPALALASFRLALAGLVYIPVYFLSAQAKQPTGEQARFLSQPDPHRRRPSVWRDYWRFAYLGFFGMLVNQGFFTYGLSFTSVSHSSLIIGFAPVLILLMSSAQGLERVTGRKLVGVILAFIGAGVVGAEHRFSFRAAGVSGDAITLCGATGLALYTVLGKRVTRAYNPVRLNVFGNFAATLMAAPVAIWQIVSLVRSGQWHHVGWQGWGAVAFMGVLSSATGYLLYMWALRYMTPTRLGAVSYLQPVGAMLLATVILAEPLTSYVVTGGIFILVGVYAIQSSARALPTRGQARGEDPQEELA